MKQKLTSFFTIGLTGIGAAGPPLLPIAAGVGIAGSAIFFARESDAQTVRGAARRTSRRTTYRRTAVAPVAPIAPAVGTRGVARRTARRTTRRHMWALPAGYRVYPYSGYQYYFAGGLYYYPYMYSGRTIYIEVDTNSAGQPLPPPSASQAVAEVAVN